MDQDNQNNEVISSVINELLQFRRERRVKDAENLKQILLNEHSVQVFYRRDGSIGWCKVQEHSKYIPKRVVWSSVGDANANAYQTDLKPLSCRFRVIPLIIATVDAPYYRTRLAETMDHLSQTHFEDGTCFKPCRTVDMLNLADHPSIGANRIVFEGWRQVLLPALSSPEFERGAGNDQIIFIAEDDVRLCKVSPGRIREVCSAIFKSNSDVHILSLGHSYAPVKPSRRQRRRAKRQLQTTDLSSASSIDVENETAPSSSLLQHLNSGKGLHGSTLLAIRHPEGTQSLLTAMEAVPIGRRYHFDQFLFHSTLHDINIAFSDPPLVGWAEVSETLTCVGSGCRRNGGGRLEQLPVVACDDVKWVRRQLY